MEGVCRKAVCHAYGVSHNIIDKAAKNVKNNIRVHEQPFDDGTRAREEFVKNMHLVAQLHELDLNDDQLAAVQIQHTDDAFTLYGWLARYIEYASDVWPSRNNDIHIPNLEKKSVWKEYCSDMTSEGLPHLSYGVFCELWSILFPNVKKKPMCGVMAVLYIDGHPEQTDRYCQT